MRDLKPLETSLFDGEGQRKYLTTRDRSEFLAASEHFDPDTELLCQVLALTGCRLSEALALRPSLVDVANSALTFETLKQRRSGAFRQVPVPSQLVSNLVAWNSQSAASDGRFFHWHRQSAWRRLQQVFELAAIDGAQASSRGLRHGFAVAAIQENIPITLIQKWLGHARLQTTAIYLGAVGEQERAFAQRLWG